MPSGPDEPVSIGRRSGLSFDTRTDLGYGRTSNNFQQPRAKASSYPYIEEDEYADDVDLDLEISVLQRLVNKTSSPYKSDDSLIGRSRDNGAFVSGNTPIMHMGEMAVAKGMVPFPDMYKGRIQVGGGVNSPMAYTPGTPIRTGTERGWSYAPENIGGDDGTEVTYDEYISGEDLNIIRLRKNIQRILRQEKEANDT